MYDRHMPRRITVNLLFTFTDKQFDLKIACGDEHFYRQKKNCEAELTLYKSDEKQ